MKLILVILRRSLNNTLIPVEDHENEYSMSFLNNTNIMNDSQRKNNIIKNDSNKMNEYSSNEAKNVIVTLHTY